MAALVVLYDACVLYPAPLRDLLMYLALTGLFQAKWSDRIHEEWIRNVLKNRSDLKREQLERVRALMDAHVRDGKVAGYEHLIETVVLPDPNDRHVLAAAIAGNANVILTFNLKDFPRSSLEPYRVETCHPDRFVADLLERDAETVCAAVKRHRASLRYPPKTVEEYLAVMAQQGLSQTVGILRDFADLL